MDLSNNRQEVNINNSSSIINNVVTTSDEGEIVH